YGREHSLSTPFACRRVVEESSRQYLSGLSRRDGREAEGTGLLNRHTWKRVSRVRIPLSPLGGSAHRTRFSLPRANDHCQTETSLRSIADRVSPRRRRAHGTF